MAEALRIHPLHDRLYARPGVVIRPCPAAERLSVRASSEAREALSAALGVELPWQRKTAATAANLSALWLGPDEWLVIGEAGSGLPSRLSGVEGHLFSAVDISHRNTALSLEGALAATVLASGCPQDLSLTAFPVGACSRTVLAKSEIVLWREAKHRFRVECWRSFSDYVWNYCVEAARTA